jgi:hypothetical protein
MTQLFQLEALSITIVTFIITLVLTLFITKGYVAKRKRSSLFWSLGMWSFTFGVLLEILFALNINYQILVSLYLFVVAILVEFLALGSMQLIASKRLKQVYYVFTALSTIFVLYTLLASSQPGVVSNYVASGVPSLMVIISSSIVTFPAAFIIAAIAIVSYMKGRDYRNLSILAGVCIVSVAGTLYIASFPAFLYISEFIGILLLWIGFFRPK